MSILTLSANVNGATNLGAYNDLYLDSFGNIATSYDLEAIVEQCAQATKTQLGEMVLNTNIGIPYANTLWVGVPNTQQFNAAITNALLSVNGVLEVVSLITSQTGNTYNYTAIIRTIYGTGVLNGNPSNGL